MMQPEPDPMPEPPAEPDFDACCGNGCDPCIFDLYDLAIGDYRQALRAWQARHPDVAAETGALASDRG